MKTRKLTILSIVLLAAIILGAVVVTVQTAKPLKAKAKWKPRVYTLDNNPPNPWIAEMYFTPARPLGEVDVATIKLEGLYGPVSTPYITLSNRLAIPFSGGDVLTCLLIKLPHMGPGEYRIDLEIAGKLIDGTDFTASGGINVVVPELPPP